MSRTTAKDNILLIAADQLRADALYGALATHIATPNFDRLAATGVAFDNHCTVTVPCGPARASLLTGLYAMNHRVIRNGAPLASQHSTVALEARKAGYEPMLFGYTDSARDPLGVPLNDPDLSIYEGLIPGFREVVEMRIESGFGWQAYLGARGYPLPRPLPERAEELFRPQAPVGSDREPQITDPALYRAADSDTAFLTDRTLEQLDARRDQPWFAHIAYLRPHPPLVAPEPYNTLVDPATLPPPLAASTAPNHPLVSLWHEQRLQKLPWQAGEHAANDCRTLDDTASQQLRAVYLGLVAELDHHIGRLLDWLDETNQAERTLVIFTSDHADMLGDFGMWGKVNVFESAYKIPLLIRDPRRPQTAGQRFDRLSESVDIAPTILDWLDLPIPPAFDGRSLLPCLSEQGSDDWRDAAFIEVDFAHPINATPYQRAWDLSYPRCNAAILRESRWKYVHFNGGLPPLLFDLDNDPAESNNLATRPDQQQQLLRLAAKMIDLRMTRNDRRLTGFAQGA